MGLSGRAGVAEWRAAKCSDDPVYPSDCGWREEMLVVLLMAVGFSCFCMDLKLAPLWKSALP